MKNTVPILVLIFSVISTMASSQIRPPGYEREVRAMEEKAQTNVLDRDTVILVDTIIVFDPETFEQTSRVVTSRLSWRDYCSERLGIPDPGVLLNGESLRITDPRTSREIIIQWNAQQTKVDTIQY